MEKIFIVDDEASVCKALSRFLRAEGLWVETFLSAQQFLDSVSPDQTGVLLLDVAMPGMNGYDLQRKMNQEHYQVKIIFITAFIEILDRKRAIKNGAIDFLQKPIDGQSLIDLIKGGKITAPEKQSSKR